MAATLRRFFQNTTGHPVYGLRVQMSAAYTYNDRESVPPASSLTTIPTGSYGVKFLLGNAYGAGAASVPDQGYMAITVTITGNSISPTGYYWLDASGVDLGPVTPLTPLIAPTGGEI
jgi:hypothetical protein